MELFCDCPLLGGPEAIIIPSAVTSPTLSPNGRAAVSVEQPGGQCASRDATYCLKVSQSVRVHEFWGLGCDHSSDVKAVRGCLAGGGGSTSQTNICNR
ncbi:hypothetical protein EYF80_037903 [Liparis tanakae]|uniref:Uncharacterized protein n=1 Tax=Liparis tanakae TaxID=230148 RepID=A0A4Z2GE89_9TELE|nr:hypothetical protein EYF80_037903 [Liparis tanakae]